MEYTIYKTYFSGPEQESITKIRDSAEFTHRFITLLGSNEVLKDQFYQKIFETTKKIQAPGFCDEIEEKDTNLPEFKGAKIFFDDATEEKAIWCNTEDIKTKELNVSSIALRNLIKYSSKIIFFIEFSDYGKLKQSESILLEILNDKDLILDLEVLVCINIISARFKLETLKENISQNYFKDLNLFSKNLKFEFIKYSDDDTDALEFFNESWIAEVKRCSKKIDLTNFFKDIKCTEDDLRTQSIAQAIDIPSNIDEILGLPAQKENIEKNPDIEELENEKTEPEKQETNLSYYQVIENNFENYVNNNCLSKTDLENWKNSKEEEINKELEIIKKIYQKRLNFFKTEERFKNFLSNNKIEVCNYIPDNRNDSESKIKYWVNQFISKKCGNHDQKDQLYVALSKIAKEFLYTVVENSLNESSNYLEKYLTEIKDDCIQLIKEFKSAPYKVEVDSDFCKLKQKWQKNNMMKYYAKEIESCETLNKRIEEFSTLLNTIKSQIPELNFKVMSCIKCGKLGTMKSENNVNFISLKELDTDGQSRKIKCESCRKEFEAIEFKGKNYHFDIDENGQVNLIKLAHY